MSDSRTIVTIGEILVEFVSHRRNCALEQISDYSGPYPSGAPAIFLDQAARMGAVTQMIGGVRSTFRANCKHLKKPFCMCRPHLLVRNRCATR